MLVYDITNEKSFDNIKNWIRNIEEVGHAPLMSRDFCYFQSSHCSELDLKRSSKKCLYDVITESCDLLYNEMTDALHQIWLSLSYFCNKEWVKISVSRCTPQKTCSCNCSERWLYKVRTQGSWIQMPHFSDFYLIYILKTMLFLYHFTIMCCFVLVYHRKSHHVCGCKMTKCVKSQRVWILFQGTA